MYRIAQLGLWTTQNIQFSIGQNTPIHYNIITTKLVQLNVWLYPFNRGIINGSLKSNYDKRNQCYKYIKYITWRYLNLKTTWVHKTVLDTFCQGRCTQISWFDFRPLLWFCHCVPVTLHFIPESIFFPFFFNFCGLYITTKTYIYFTFYKIQIK